MLKIRNKIFTFNKDEEVYMGHLSIWNKETEVHFYGAINRDYELKNGLYVPNDKMKIRSEKIGNAYLNPEIHIKKDGTVISGKEASYFGALSPSESVAL